MSMIVGALTIMTGCFLMGLGVGIQVNDNMHPLTAAPMAILLYVPSIVAGGCAACYWLSRS